MPLIHRTKVFGAKDAKVAKVLTDVSGGAITYATGVDFPGIKTVAIKGDINSQDLRGDNTLLDSASVLKSISADLEYAKMDLDVLAAIMGTTVVDAGVTPSQTSTTDLASTVVLPYFKVTAQAAGADTVGGDVVYTLHKCIMDGFPEMGLAEEDYQTSKISVRCLPTLATGNKWISVALNETAVVLT